MPDQHSDAVMLPSGFLAILFADISGSTAMYEALGDARARDAVSRCFTIMNDAISHQRGRLIKTIGDEAMATFADADAAAAAAVEMQERISGKQRVDGKRLRIRVGFHFGEALLESNDVFGQAVNVAARMVGHAKPAQIVTSAPTLARLGEGWKGVARQIDMAEVRGTSGQVGLYEILWQRADLTRMSTTAFRRFVATDRPRLVLHYKDRRIEVSADHRACSMGRDDDNELVLAAAHVSRSHCRIEYRKGNFTLVDQSINGTYVCDDGGGESFVRRNALTLQGSGMLGLGRRLDGTSPEIVRFKIEQRAPDAS
ncbi:MAG TPA: adenylate/guanylate cyclase domain-containing protein [Candidatus Binatia bacterium]|nr:adenylate/guanylate cyclase domain-containing protein [Candidatus Binatia bacterium]